MVAPLGVRRVVSIVDDDESVRLATALLVTSLGLEAIGFSSAADFLASAEAEEACCLILDVNMPGMNGLELQETLQHRCPQLPVIFITAFPSDEIEQRAKASGAICFLVKPFKPDALLKCIEAALVHDAHRVAAGRKA